MTRRTSTPREATSRSALLVDLENILHVPEHPAAGSTRCCDDVATHAALAAPLPVGVRDMWLCPAMAARTMDEVLDLAGNVDYVVAAAAADSLLRRTAFVLDERGVALRVVPFAPDAADRYLLDLAWHLADRGFSRFVIASGDSMFTAFAGLHPTTVIARSTSSLATGLRIRAERSFFLSPAPAAAMPVPA
ncbi:hypothetical protein [Nocardioides pakistanensis]